ncbi:GntR family transcriptional regulator [Rhodopseudomonas palustris]|uniref:GntR family transcriptional regulator n=1 Tax=Rhodopseudomonas palustris TaxID=1076 RepID=A0A323UFN3_RHOPL|nr:GntR family transcriptional regulator [Rhodopseudomonas palustris]PZA11732.1 GntR family transcriptional regulator [Rhodopseudomonas palustris]
MPKTDSNLNVSREATSLRLLVENRLRSAIGSGVFKPGQRLIERELCEQTGVGRTSIREALRQLEAEGLVTTIPHRGPIVSTITADEAAQLYDLRALLEGFAGRECAKRRDPAIIGRLRTQYERMSAVAGNDDRSELLAAKTEFYAALLEGCGNVFVERFLKMLLNRVTVLRMTSMTQPNRIGRSLLEIGTILDAIENGDEDGAERACVEHINNAAAIALEALRRGEP